MEGNPKPKERPLARSYETHRLEERLWTAAYEQIWPIVRAKIRPQVEPVEATTASQKQMARRA